MAPERCLKISTAILSACRCLSNDDISNSIRAIAAINPPSTTGGSLLGLAGNSSDAVANVAGSPATPSPAAILLRCSLDHLRNDQMLTPSSLARSFAGTPPVCNRCTAATLKFSSTFFRALLLEDVRMFEKSCQIKTYGMRTRVRPSCLEARMGNHSL